MRIFRPIRAAYRDHIVKLLSLAGEPAAEISADGIIALETALARLQWTRVENRDPIKTYNKREIIGAAGAGRRRTTGRPIFPPPASARTSAP